MSPDIKERRPLQYLVRKEEPDELEAQVRALKELERQPGFLAARAISRTKNRGTPRTGWISRLLRFFRRKH